MYGFQSTLSGGAVKAVLIFVGLLLVGAVSVGVLLGDSELLDPSLHTAEVDKLRAETEALRAQTAYEQRQREIELRLAEEKAAIELQALQDRRAREPELLELAAIVGLVVGSVVVSALAVAVSYYLIAQARGLPQGPAVKGIQRPDQQTHPSVPQRGQGSIPERATGSFSIQRSEVSPDRISYDGFLAFCSDFILSNGHQALTLDYTRPDDSRRYYLEGISVDVADAYLTILRKARIITAGANSHSEWTLRRQIKDLNDIQLRIPCTVFQDTVDPRLFLNRLERVTPPGTKPGSKLKVLQSNNNACSAQHPPVLSTPRRRTETKPAA